MRANHIPHKHALKLHVFSSYIAKKHGQPFNGVKILTQKNGRTVLVCNFESCLCGSFYSPLKHHSNHVHFTAAGFKRFSKNQLDRSKSTCSLNSGSISRDGSLMHGIFSDGDEPLRTQHDMRMRLIDRFHPLDIFFTSMVSRPPTAQL